MVRVWAQTACRANSQSANIIPGSPIALEGMPPTDELLAGIVCLSPALAGSLRDAVVAHVVGNTEDEDLNIQRDWILHSIFLPRASYFLVVPPEDCVGPEGAQEKSRKMEGWGQGTTFERMTEPKGIT